MLGCEQQETSEDHERPANFGTKILGKKEKLAELAIRSCTKQN
jgi:hypothetical protein